jgi:hypothetical protein
MNASSRIALATGTLLVCCVVDFLVVLSAVFPYWYNSHVSYYALTSPPAPVALELILLSRVSDSLSLYDTVVHGSDWRILVGAVLVQCLGVASWAICQYIVAWHKFASMCAVLVIGCCVLIAVVISLRVFSPINNGTVMANRYLGYRVILNIVPTTLAYFGVGLAFVSVALAAATVRLGTLGRRSPTS